MLKQSLVYCDNTLVLERDCTIYRHEGRYKTAKKVMGTVGYSRSVYQHINEDGTKNCVFLFDEALGKEGRSLTNGNLAELGDFCRL